jgi:tRNA nucleotidyltransferase (CCA-adding enzyme)
MAFDAAGALIDPYGGAADLKAGILRHVSHAFAEDPVRSLRAARFAARFGFSIAPETQVLMTSMVQHGEVDALLPERVWQELARALMEKQPSRFFTALRECGALQKIFPEIDALFGVPQPAGYHPEIDCGIHVMLVLDDAARHNHALPVRFAALTHDLGKGNTPKEILPRHIGHEQRGVTLLQALCARTRVPAECRDLALLVTRYHSDIHRARELRPDTIVRLFSHCDAWRRPERFTQILQACASDARGRTGHEHDAYPQADYLLQALRAAQQVDAGAIARACADKTQIATHVQRARIAAVAHAMPAAA